MSVHDRLGEPGRARGVQDVERVIERDRLEREGFAPREELFPGEGAGETRLFEVCAEVGEDDRRFERRKLALELSDLLRAVDFPRAVAIPVDREQQLRLDLADAIGDSARAELRRTGGKDGANRRGREQRHQSLGHVRKVGDDPISLFDAEAAKPSRRAADGVGEVRAAPDHVFHAGLRSGDDGRPAGSAREGGLRVVERGAGKPSPARHPSIREDLARVVAGENLEVVSNRPPELLDLGHRPGPERPVSVEVEAARAPQEIEVRADARLLPRVGGRSPENSGIRHRREFSPRRAGEAHGRFW